MIKVILRKKPYIFLLNSENFEYIYFDFGLMANMYSKDDVSLIIIPKIRHTSLVDLPCLDQYFIFEPRIKILSWVFYSKIWNTNSAET